MSSPHSDLKKVFLLHRLEEADPLGKCLSLERRDRMTKEVGAIPDASPFPPALEFLSRRAGGLMASLSEPLRKVLAQVLTFPPSWLQAVGPAIIAAALLLGWFSNSLGPDRLINILSFPLLGLALWNLTVCSFMLVGYLRHRTSSGSSSSWLDHWPGRNHLTEKLLAGFSDAREKEISANAIEQFLTGWNRLWAGVHAARAKLVFHCAAIALALGIVGGMYFQGLQKEYRAAWESTFLDSAGLHRLLSVVLGPASSMTGIPVAPAAELETMRLHPGQSPSAAGGHAAPFIHLWAATAGIFILLPRLVLVALAWREKRRQQPDLSILLRPLLDSLRSAEAGNVTVVQVLPVHFTPTSAALEAVRSLILHLWGGRSRMDLSAKLELGEEEDFLEISLLSGGPVVVLFSFSSTPEHDVQGELLQELEEKHGRLLTILDATSFEQRLGQLPEFTQRFAQRRAAWERILDGRDYLVLDESLRRSPQAALSALPSRR